MSRSSLILSALTLVALSGCATGNPANNSYQQELRRLEQDCTARGGILAPALGGAQSGRPQTDYTCNISGGASRLGD
jgi:hypothetical protein